MNGLISDFFYDDYLTASRALLALIDASYHFMVIMFVTMKYDYHHSTMLFCVTILCDYDYCDGDDYVCSDNDSEYSVFDFENHNMIL